MHAIYESTGSGVLLTSESNITNVSPAPRADYFLAFSFTVKWRRRPKKRYGTDFTAELQTAVIRQRIREILHSRLATILLRSAITPPPSSQTEMTTRSS